jgi:zinc protease
VNVYYKAYRKQRLDQQAELPAGARLGSAPLRPRRASPTKSNKRVAPGLNVGLRRRSFPEPQGGKPMLGRSGAAVGLALTSRLPALADEPVTSFTLDNGLEGGGDRRSPRPGGGADDLVSRRCRRRTARPFRHRAFPGTPDVQGHREGRAQREFSGIVEAQGGDDNAFTSWDYTAYFQRIAADRLDLVMEMEADRMRNLRLTEEDVATERQVILEERASAPTATPARF